MNKRDYEKLRAEQLPLLKGKKLLLHCCCAPCASACLERLYGDFDITAYFYNPNITDSEEYDKRVKELERFTKEVYGEQIKVISEPLCASEFYNIAKGKENAPEGGARCYECYKLRLERCAQYAKKQGYSAISTTLSVSPYKNAEWLNALGEEVCARYGITWVYADFKKANGYKRSIELSKEHGLYRQNYCGCEFSKNRGEA